MNNVLLRSNGAELSVHTVYYIFLSHHDMATISTIVGVRIDFMHIVHVRLCQFFTRKQEQNCSIPPEQLHFKQHHPMQWKRVLICCTLQFLHSDWFLLPLLSAGHCGVMDKWLDTHARGRGFKPSSC